MPIAGDAVGGFRGHRGRGNHQQNQQQPVPRRPGGQQNPYNPPPQVNFKYFIIVVAKLFRVDFSFTKSFHMLLAKRNILIYNLVQICIIS